MDDIPAFLSLEQVYLHYVSITGLSRGDFLLEVRDLLAGGKLPSSGRSRRLGDRRVDIPGDAWRDYEPFFDNGGYASRVMVNGINTRPDLPVFGFGDIRFPREVVLALWGATRVASKIEGPPSEEDIRTLVRKMVAENGGYMAQRAGAQKVREVYPEHTKQGHALLRMDYLESLFAEANGTVKRGPKGSRNNSRN